HGYRLLQSGSGFYYAHNAGISYIIPDQFSIEAGLVVTSSIAPNENEIHYPSDISINGKDSLWISQEKGFISLLNKGALQHFQPDKDNNSFQLTAHKKNLYALSKDGKLYRFDSDKSNFSFIKSFPGCHTFIPTEEGFFFAGDNLVYVQLNENGTIRDEKNVQLQEKNKIISIAGLARDQLLVSIETKGIYSLNHTSFINASLKKIYSNNDPHRVDELPFKSVNRIIVNETDRSILLCLNNGLGVLKKRFFESVNDLHNGSTTSITSNGDDVYVNMGEIYKVSPIQSGFEAQLIDLPTTESVGSVHYFNDQLLCGTGEGKIYSFKNDLTELIDLTDRGEGVFYMHGDKKNRLWVCQAPDENPIVGIACILPDGQLKEYGKSKGLDNRILVVKESARGRIYVAGIGEESYLYRYSEEEDRYENMSLPFEFDIGNNFEVHDLAVGHDGTIYLASTAGLLRHDLDRIVKIDLGDKYGNIEIRSVHITENDKLWISTETQGVLFIDDENIISISEESGLPSKVMSYRGIFNDHNNRLWIGTAEGAVYTLTEGPTLPITGKPFLFNSNFNFRDTCLTGNEGDNLVLNMKTVSSYRDRVWYQYSINNSIWSSPIEGNKILIEDLEKGNHFLQVRSKINGGYNWSNAYSVSIYIKPKWFKNPIIYIPILFFGFGSLIYLLLKSRNRLIPDQEGNTESNHYKYESPPLEGERMEVLGSIISRLNFGIKWDFILEELSISLFRLNNVDAFIICWKERNNAIVYEGATRNQKLYGRIDDAINNSLLNQCIIKGKVILIESLEEISDSDPTFASYKSVAGMPFHLGAKGKGAIFLMSTETLDQGHLSLLHPLSSYLEQII
ncbi:MAG: hypothetical protein HKN68_16550, partial [Saprospiraceae bacterium]|nr:hypothetical protein [Saprospiraceae bacterium]